jgi:hypothetical protein
MVKTVARVGATLLVASLAAGGGVSHLAVSGTVGAQGTPSSASAARPQIIAAPHAAAHDGSAIALRPLVDRYCVGCHNGRLLTAGLALDRPELDTVGAHPEVWEKVVLKLRAGAMPPPGLPRPDAQTLDRIAAGLEAALDRAWASDPRPGRPLIHRLNRAEYTNAVRDLLALDIDGRALLPPDASGYGFDNIADVLSLSPALLDRYLFAAERVSGLAVGRSLRPLVQTYTVRPTLLQDDRMSELLPFGTRGGTAVRHYFPTDGEYVIKIRLQRTHTNAIRGLNEPHDVDVRLDRVPIGSYRIGGDGPLEPWSSVPGASFYEQSADDGLEIRLAVKAGMRVIGVAFPRKGRVGEGALEPRLSVSTYEYAGDRDLPMGVQAIEISGPYGATDPADTPSRRRIFTCRPAQPADELTCATRILSALSRRAYRRPVTDDDLRALLDLYSLGSRGAPPAERFDAGIELALRTLLVDPAFLFRLERDPAGIAPGTIYPIGLFELASRLSFFLWSSIPDDELLDLAERGVLRDPAMLARQVERMVRDPRADALLSNFFGQWLYLRNVRTTAPDPDAFPDFDENLREAFQRETELFLQAQIRDDRSLLDLVTADYTYANERLARHYGIPGVRGNRFRRVTVPDTRRAGLLGHGSILMVTSYANRTSPTVRGKWILESLLGAPPPAPPPDVPALAEADEATGAAVSVRGRLERHRQNPVCASCHAGMDPLGLALENFDAIGRWRTTDGGTAIDAVASLPGGTIVAGPAGVRDLLLDRRERFVQTVTEKLLTYALGRGLSHHDAPAVRQIARQAAGHDYRWSSVLAGIVTSAPFQMRRSLP